MSYRKLTLEELKKLAPKIQNLKEPEPLSQPYFFKGDVARFIEQNYKDKSKIVSLVIYMDSEYDDEWYSGNAQFVEALDVNDDIISPSTATPDFLTSVRDLSIENQENYIGQIIWQVKPKATTIPELYIKE